MAGPVGTPSPQPASEVFDSLADRKLLVVSGKGGVGRTTMAAVLGLALADRGRRVLVCTTGQDDRLAWMLGANRLRDEPKQVADGLFIARLTPQVCIREYGAIVLRSERLSSAVFDNRVVRRLLRAIPGLDDFAVIGKAWHEALRGEDVDLVIFDGPATGHLMYTVGVPKAILGAVPRGPLTSEAQLMQESFEDPSRVQAVLVGLGEQWPLTELGELGAALRERVNMNVGAVFVNSVWPQDAPVPGRIGDDEVDGAVSHVRRVVDIGRRHRESIDEWAQSDAARRCGPAAIVEVPWQWEGVLDLDGIQVLLDRLEGRASVSHAGSG